MSSQSPVGGEHQQSMDSTVGFRDSDPIINVKSSSILPMPRWLILFTFIACISIVLVPLVSLGVHDAGGYYHSQIENYEFDTSIADYYVICSLISIFLSSFSALSANRFFLVGSLAVLISITVAKALLLNILSDKLVLLCFIWTAVLSFVPILLTLSFAWKKYNSQSIDALKLKSLLSEGERNDYSNDDVEGGTTFKDASSYKPIPSQELDGNDDDKPHATMGRLTSWGKNYCSVMNESILLDRSDHSVVCS